MKTFLINEQYKKTIRGGKWLYKVSIWENGIETDITKSVAELGNRKKKYDGTNLIISNRDRDGKMIITMILNVNWGYDINIVNVPMS